MRWFEIERSELDCSNPVFKAHATKDFDVIVRGFSTPGQTGF